MHLLGYILLAVVVVFVLAALSPPVRRLGRAILDSLGATTDRAAERLAKTDPLGVYKTQIANAAEGGKNASKVVETAAKQLESLDRQIKEGEKEKTRLENRIQTVLDSGDPNKTAERYALDLERVETNLAANREQHTAALEAYNDNVALVEKYERDIAEARKDANALGFQLEQSAAEAQLHKMNAALKADLGTTDFGAARRRVQEQIDANKGQSRAARDLNRSAIAEGADEDLERQQRAGDILARFKKPKAD